MDYIDEHKKAFGVEPICTVLASADVPIAPSTYYAGRARVPSARAVRDEQVRTEISRVHRENYGVYGIRKVHAQLGREGGVHGRPVARCTVARLMKAAGLRGVSRAKGPRTTLARSGPDSRPDLVKRDFTATAQDRLWVADLTYVRTFVGWVYCAFILDVFSRRVVGWQVSTSLRTDLALDALQMGLWTRQRDRHDISALVHHSDRGVQYLAVRYTERLAEAGAVASVGSKGDSYDTQSRMGVGVGPCGLTRVTTGLAALALICRRHGPTSTGAVRPATGRDPIGALPRHRECPVRPWLVSTARPCTRATTGPSRDPARTTRQASFRGVEQRSARRRHPQAHACRRRPGRAGPPGVRRAVPRDRSR